MKYTDEWIDRELNPELLSHDFKQCSGCLRSLSLENFRIKSNRCNTCISSIARSKRQQDPVKTTWERARSRAKKSGIEFSVTIEHVRSIWTDICPIYLIPLRTNQGTPGPDSHSIDRIDNAKGYIPGNIAIVSMRFNSEKRNLTPDLLRRMLAYIEGRLF